MQIARNLPVYHMYDVLEHSMDYMHKGVIRNITCNLMMWTFKVVKL